MRVEIRRRQDELPAWQVAQLCDLSRQGIQLQMDQALTDGDPVEIRICDLESDFELVVAATVRWQRSLGNAWAVGCQLNEQLEWEVYGELFLNEILESD